MTHNTPGRRPRVAAVQFGIKKDIRTGEIKVLFGVAPIFHKAKVIRINGRKVTVETYKIG